MADLSWENFFKLSGEDLEAFNKEHDLSFLPGETAIAQRYLRSQLPRYEREGTTVDQDLIQLSLEVNGQSWCEHSAHGTIQGRIRLVDYSTSESEPRIVTYERLLKDTIMKATEELNKPYVRMAFKADAGIIDFVTHKGRRYGFAGKCESHNFPFGEGPFGGTDTCTGGVYRDIWSVLADLRCGTYILILPDPDTPLKFAERKPPMVYMTEGNRGNQDYGNSMGVPTVMAISHFSPANVNNPLCFGGAFGLVDLDYYEQTVREGAAPGDVVMLIGGRTGRDGMHGATLSSVGRTGYENVESLVAGVQIGNPIEEQSWSYALVEDLFARRLVKYCQDFGGGGLSSFAFETAKKTGGTDVYIDAVRTKEEGMSATEKIISESQERQGAVVSPGNVDEVTRTFARYGVEAYPIAHLTNNGRARVYDNESSKRVLMDMDLGFLHGGKPTVERTATFHVKQLPEPRIAVNGDLTPELKKVLSSYTACSNEETQVRIFDHQVQGGTIIPQLTGPRYDGPNDAVVYRPIYDCNAGWVISVDTDERKTLKHAGLGVRAIIDNAIRKNAVHGGTLDRMTIFDNWAMANCKGDDEELGRLAVGLEAFAQCEYEYDLPCDVGKDSMNNHYKGFYIAPTLVCHSRSVIDDVRTAVTSFAKRPGNLVYLVGVTKPEMGGSIFYWVQDGSAEKEPLAGWEYYHIKGYVGNDIPVIDGNMAGKMYRALSRIVTTGIMPKEKVIRAAKAVSHGGLGVAAAQMAFGGCLGMELYMNKLKTEGEIQDWQALFSESLGRVLVEVPPERQSEFEGRMGKYPIAQVGVVTDTPQLTIYGRNGNVAVAGNIEEFREAWKAPLRGY